MARILIIDDDKSFREALAESVRDFGHDVVEASGAQEAFKLIGNVDAAFLDLKMPGISGIEFLRETKPMAPVIVLTAFADSSNTIEAIKLGAFDHLTKPIGRSDLQRVLAEALKNPQSTPGGDSPPSGDELIGFSSGMREGLQMAVTESPAENQIEDLLELDFHSAVSRFEKLLLTKA